MYTPKGRLLLASSCFFIAIMIAACGKSEQTQQENDTSSSITDLARSTMGGTTFEEEQASIGKIVEAAGYKAKSYVVFPTQEVDRKGRMLIYSDPKGKSGGLIYFKRMADEVKPAWHWYFADFVPDSVEQVEINGDGLWDVRVFAPGGRVIDFVQDDTFTLMASERNDWLALNGASSPAASPDTALWHCFDGNAKTTWSTPVGTGEAYVQLEAPFGVSEGVLAVQTTDKDQPHHCTLFADGQKVQEFDLKEEAADQMVQLEPGVKGAKSLRIVIDSAYGNDGVASIAELALQ